MNLKQVVSIAGIVGGSLSLGGVAIAAGRALQKSDDLERRMVAQEKADAGTQDILRQMSKEIGEINGSLKVLVQDRKKP